MIVDPATVRRVARLARLRVDEGELATLGQELGAILGFVEQLQGVDVEGVEPLAAVHPVPLRQRRDEVTDGEIVAAVLANAPEREDDFFVVPKVIE